MIGRIVWVFGMTSRVSIREAKAVNPYAHIEEPLPGEFVGVYEDGAIRLSSPVDWPEGTPVVIRVAELKPGCDASFFGRVIVAGFGLAGRSVAGICQRYGIDYVVVERNPRTINTQRELGRQVIEGDIAQEEVLRAAGVEDASLIALTVPDDTAIRRATQLARNLNPNIYIIGRSTYSSTGMQIEKLGADDVIKVEQLVAREFYEHLMRKLGCRGERANSTPANTVSTSPQR